MSMRALPHRLSILALLLGAAVACQSDQAKIAEHMARGDEYAEQKKQAEAIIEYKSVLQLDPNHAAAHYALAKAYLRNNLAREGYWELRESVRLDPVQPGGEGRVRAARDRGGRARGGARAERGRDRRRPGPRSRAT